MLKCEEDAAYVQSDLWGTDVVNKEKSNSTCSSQLEAQGELQFDSCNSLNEVEYQAFVFLVEGFHDSVSDG